VNVRKYAKAKQASFSRLADLSERYKNRDELPFKICLKVMREQTKKARYV